MPDSTVVIHIRMGIRIIWPKPAITRSSGHHRQGDERVRQIHSAVVVDIAQLPAIRVLKGIGIRDAFGRIGCGPVTRIAGAVMTAPVIAADDRPVVPDTGAVVHGVDTVANEAVAVEEKSRAHGVDPHRTAGQRVFADGLAGAGHQNAGLAVGNRVVSYGVVVPADIETRDAFDDFIVLDDLGAASGGDADGSIGNPVVADQRPRLVVADSPDVLIAIDDRVVFDNGSRSPPGIDPLSPGAADLISPDRMIRSRAADRTVDILVYYIVFNANIAGIFQIDGPETAGNRAAGEGPRVRSEKTDSRITQDAILDADVGIVNLETAIWPFMTANRKIRAPDL